MNIKKHTYFDLFGWDYKRNRSVADRLRLDLAYYKDMVEMGDESFHGAIKARQRVSFQNAIESIEKQLKQLENND